MRLHGCSFVLVAGCCFYFAHSELASFSATFFRLTPSESARLLLTANSRAIEPLTQFHTLSGFLNSSARLDPAAIRAAR
jgi:hypothetical protein